MSVNQPDPKMTCPYTGHRRKCAKLYMHCPKWIHIMGMDKQTGVQIDECGCADSFGHMLQIDASQQMREAGAAVESLRNVLVVAAENLTGVISSSSSPKLRGPG